MKSKRKRHANEFLRTSLANSGRIAGTGMLYDNYSLFPKEKGGHTTNGGREKI